MKAHEERVVIEKNELKEKLDKLDTFIDGETFQSLEQVEKRLLLRQCVFMREYLNVLELRIKNFE